jgi:hypothetical protein
MVRVYNTNAVLPCPSHNGSSVEPLCVLKFVSCYFHKLDANSMYRLFAKSPTSHHILFYLIISHLIPSYLILFHLILVSYDSISLNHIPSYHISSLTPPMIPHNVASHRITSCLQFNIPSITSYLLSPSPPLPSHPLLSSPTVLFCSVHL